MPVWLTKNVLDLAFGQQVAEGGKGHNKAKDLPEKSKY
jgi:hypothetical protein